VLSVSGKGPDEVLLHVIAYRLGGGKLYEGCSTGVYRE
jgi:hypothetical protein